MTSLRDSVTMDEKTVQKLARVGKVRSRAGRPTGKARRSNNSRVVVRSWKDGLDPRIVKAIEAMKLRDMSRINKISSTEVVIMNNGNWPYGRRGNR